MKTKLLCAGVLAFFAHAAHSTTYYVSTIGSDSNAGTSASEPFRTINKGVNTARAGDTVLVRGGTYREQVEMHTGGTAGNPIRVFAYPGEIPVIKGSDVVTGWVADSTLVWKKTGWQHSSQQLFVDFGTRPGKSLQQIGMPSSYYTSWEYPKPVGSGRSSMKPGSFYYDKASSTLYLWIADGSSPNRHVIEASVRRRLFFMHQPYVHLKGFAFRHSNLSAFAQQGAAVELSANSTIEACDIQYTDFSGLSMGYQQDGARALDCNVSNNGDSGVVAVGSRNFWIARTAMNGNNSRNFNALWHAGGFKGTANAYGVLERNEIAGNNGSGVWFDYARSGNPLVVRGNFIHDNGPLDAAIFIEVSAAAQIYNNVLVNNTRRGIYIAASTNSRVYNNTVVGTAGRSAIEVGGMPRSGATLTGNEVFNNLVSNGSSQYDLYLLPDDGSSIANNRSDYNLFYRSAGWISLWRGSAYIDLAAWRSATGLDAYSVSAAPGFAGATVPPLGSNYALASGSPAIDAGTSLRSVVGGDYLDVPRPSGSAYDIGAFEMLAPATAGLADAAPPMVAIAGGVSLLKSPLKISASAVDNIGVTAMQLFVDGVLKASSALGEIVYLWNSPSSGKHEVRVTASDPAGNAGSVTATYSVQ